MNPRLKVIINLNKNGEIIPLDDERHRAREKTPLGVCGFGVVSLFVCFCFFFLRMLKHLQIFHAGNSDT